MLDEGVTYGAVWIERGGQSEIHRYLGQAGVSSLRISSDALRDQPSRALYGGLFRALDQDARLIEELRFIHSLGGGSGVTAG